MRWHWLVILMSCLSFVLIHSHPAPLTIDELADRAVIAQMRISLRPLTFDEIWECGGLYHADLHAKEKLDAAMPRLEHFRDWKVSAKKPIPVSYDPPKELTYNQRWVRDLSNYHEFCIHEETCIDKKKS